MKTISQNVPMCPKCSAMMSRRHQHDQTYYFCHDCLSIYKVIGMGKAEIEIIITDRADEDLEVAG